MPLSSAPISALPLDRLWMIAEASLVVLVIDVCVVMLLLGIVKVAFFHMSAVFLLIPIGLLGIIITVWLVRKIGMLFAEHSEDKKSSK